MWPSPGETRHKLPGMPSQWSYMGAHLILPVVKYDNMCNVLPTRGAHLNHEVYDFYWGSVMRSAHVIDLSPSDRSPLQIKNKHSP